MMLGVSQILQQPCEAGELLSTAPQVSEGGGVRKLSMITGLDLRVSGPTFLQASSMEDACKNVGQASSMEVVHCLSAALNHVPPIPGCVGVITWVWQHGKNMTKKGTVS